MLKLTATAICLALALTGIAGCGKKSPEPKPLDQTSATDSGQPTPPPTLPPEVRQRNEAGVKATVEAFVEAWNYAANTGQTERLEELFTGSCLKCIGAVRTAHKTYANGGRFENSDWKIDRFVFKGFEEGTAFVEIYVSYGASRYLASANASPEAYPPGDNVIHFVQLEWHRTKGWLVKALDPEP